MLDITRNDQVCRRLMTVPGVGPVVSLAFASMVDDVDQFPTAEHLASYLALVPGENTTGGKIKRTGVIKAGPSLIRAVLVQAAWSTWRTEPESPLVQWAKRISERKGKKVAIVALARKLSAIMYAMWTLNAARWRIPLLRHPNAHSRMQQRATVDHGQDASFLHSGPNSCVTTRPGSSLPWTARPLHSRIRTRTRIRREIERGVPPTRDLRGAPAGAPARAPKHRRR